MEDTLGENIWPSKKNEAGGLNPYSNGRYSRRNDGINPMYQGKKGLNPYSNGRYSRRNLQL